jgi:hypothetical protein
VASCISMDSIGLHEKGLAEHEGDYVTHGVSGTSERSPCSSKCLWSSIISKS